MGDLRPDEYWAKRMIEAALGVPVTQHDDNSRDSMHDLEIEYPNGRRGAVEVTQDADGELLAMWNAADRGGRWINEHLVGGWTVHVRPEAVIKRLRNELPPILLSHEASSVRELPRDGWRRDRLPAAGLLDDLGVAGLAQYETAYPGSIYLLPELPVGRTGGMVDDHADAVAAWIGPFLLEAAQADVLRKLEASGAAERHAFVIVAPFSRAAFAVADPLMRDEAGLPRVPPTLPDPVTHVWTVSGWRNGVGMRWSPEAGWERFSKLQD